MAERGTRKLKELRRRCEDRMQHLSVPVPFDLESFCRAVAAREGRRLVLQPMANVGGRTMGAWIRVPEADIIVFEQNTTRLHQEHIALHEISHIICRHEAPGLDPVVIASLFPDVDADVVRGVLQRHSYSTDEELEAEVQASVIRERAGSQTPHEPLTTTGDASILMRLEAFSRGENPD
jgi:CUE domain-containing protein